MVFGLLACSSEGNLSPVRGAGGAATGGSGGTSGSDASAGSGGAVGGDAGTSPDGGSDAGPDASGGGSSDGGAIDTACTGAKAFVANGAAYVFPTPPALAAALGAWSYDASTQPLTVVLAVKDDGTAVTAASASQVAEGGFVHAFPAVMQPDLVPALVKPGGFLSAAQQKAGWLAIVDQVGSKYVKLENVSHTTSTSAGCSAALVALTAVIPASEGSVALELPSESTTLGKLAGPSNGGAWDVKVLFTAASTDFDFGSP